MNLKDKIVVITGASRGFGKVLAETLAREGSKLVLSAHSEKELREAARNISADYFVCDVSNEEQVGALLSFTLEKHGRLDIWVNNAGIITNRRRAEDLEDNKLRKIFDVNFFGTVYGSRVAIFQMKKQGGGTILNIISTTALKSCPLRAGYSASKFAVSGFTKAIREENRDNDIQVLSIYPGGIKTDLFREEKQPGFDDFLDPKEVVKVAVENLKKDKPDEEVIIKRDDQELGDT